MKKYLLPSIIFVFGLVSYVSWKYVVPTEHKESHKPAPGELVFTKNENAAIDKWLNTSGDDIANAVDENDPAALWIQGMFSLTGSAGWPIDTQTAYHFFASSASLGFAPALDQLRIMYASEEGNAFLSLVYLNLTVSAGHPELLDLYNEIRSSLIKNDGIAITKEIEKIAAYKKSYISRLTENIKKAPNSRRWRGVGKITDEDVLFDPEFWTNILNGHLVTGNLDKWLNNNENYSRKIERLAQKAQNDIDRLSSYKLLSDDVQC